MKASENLVYWVLAGIMLLGVGLLTKALVFSGAKDDLPYAKVQNKKSDVPSYKGITVNRVLVNDLTKGDGPKIEVGDQFEFQVKAWIYDPAAIGNRGQTLQPTTNGQHTLSEPRPETLDYYMRDFRLGSERQWVVPNKNKGLFSHLITNEIPENAILLIEMKTIGK